MRYARPKMSAHNQLQQNLKKTASNLAADKAKEEALKQADNPVLLQQVKDEFIAHPDQRTQMIGAAAAQSYSVNPVYLNPQTLNELVALDPAAAVAYVKKDYDRDKMIGITSNASPRNENLLRLAFQENAELITEETFKYAYAAAANYLPSVDKDMTLAEELCYSHPQFRTLFRGLNVTDFDQRIKDRESLKQQPK
jgi:hypothetical protein